MRNGTLLCESLQSLKMIFSCTITVTLGMMRKLLTASMTSHLKVLPKMDLENAETLSPISTLDCIS